MSKNNKAKVAVTGATGFIGRQLVCTLSANGYEVVLFGRDYSRLKQLLNKEDESFTVVVTDYGQGLVKQLKGIKAIVHLAGMRYQKGNTLEDYLQHNLSLTQRLFSAASVNGIRDIIFASTRSVYNPKINKLPFKEDEDCTPTTAYGVSKFVCEKIANYYNQEFKLRIKCLRIGQVVDTYAHCEYMLGTMLKRAANRETIEVWGEGRGARDYVYIKDVTRAILKALERSKVRGVFNIGSGEAVTHLQLAETINDAFGNSGNFVFVPEKYEDTQCYLMSTERTNYELDWKAEWTLKDMFLDLACEYRAQLANF